MPLPRTPAQRYAKWSAKYDPATISARFTQVKDLAMQLAQEGMTAFAVLDTIVSAILDRHGVPGTERIKYRNFSRVALRLAKRFTGAALVKRLSGEKLKFVEAYGCDPDILDEIAEAVTGIAPGY